VASSKNMSKTSKNPQNTLKNLQKTLKKNSHKKLIKSSKNPTKPSIIPQILVIWSFEIFEVLSLFYMVNGSVI
jgi:hypothetical protein